MVINNILDDLDEQTCNNFTIEYLSSARESSSSQYLDDGISKKNFKLM